jgi:hypothetical protein
MNLPVNSIFLPGSSVPVPMCFKTQNVKQKNQTSKHQTQFFFFFFFSDL